LGKAYTYLRQMGDEYYSVRAKLFARLVTIGKVPATLLDELPDSANYSVTQKGAEWHMAGVGPQKVSEQKLGFHAAIKGLTDECTMVITREQAQQLPAEFGFVFPTEEEGQKLKTKAHQEEFIAFRAKQLGRLAASGKLPQKLLDQAPATVNFGIMTMSTASGKETHSTGVGRQQETTETIGTLVMAKNLTDECTLVLSRKQAKHVPK